MKTGDIVKEDLEWREHTPHQTDIVPLTQAVSYCGNFSAKNRPYKMSRGISRS